MLAQELTATGIEHAHDPAIPLHFDAPSDPTKRHAVVSGFDFDAAIEIHPPLAKLIMPEGFQRQRGQGGLLFSEHRSYLPLHCAVNARVGPV